MTFKEYIYHIQLALNKSSIKDDNRVDNRQIASLINIYRARDIRDTYKRDLHLDPSWVQNMGICETVKVNASDDPLVNCGKVKLGKVRIPNIVSLPDDAGLVEVKDCKNEKDVRMLSIDRFNSMVSSVEATSKVNLCGLGASVNKNGQFATRVGNNVYTYPLMKEVSLNLVLEDPRDGYLMNDALVKNDCIKYDVEYEVVRGTARYGGESYTPKQTFKGVQGITSYEGNAEVYIAGRKRKLTEEDEYPMPATHATQVLMRILTEYFRIEAASVADTINDAKDEFRKVSDERRNR